MHDDALIDAHKEWLGYVQPVGLLVAPAALVHRGIIPDRHVAPLQERLDAATRASSDAEPLVSDFAEFATSFLGWEHRDLAGAPGGPPLAPALTVDLIEYNDQLKPTYAVPVAGDDANAWQMLIGVEAAGIDFDQTPHDDGKRWTVSPHSRFERLLRETNIAIGLITNGKSFRLVYAPKGETSGFATFDLQPMLEVAGRPMLSAFHMLLKVERLFGAAEQNLPALLAESREYQETVSKELAEQVLVAMNELLRGFHAADLRTHRATTVDLVKSDPDHLYSGLLTALLRTVFILYAEDRDLFPRDEIWEQNYSLGGLFERLRDDAALYPDTMDDRYGAWAQLLTLWRLTYFGAQHADLKLVARQGQLFDPARFPFLEGIGDGVASAELPSVSDGVVWRILQSLMLLGGERLSYRTLDVEQIGSVYQSVMGFTIELTRGNSVAIRSPKRGGAPAVINIDDLLIEGPARRPEWIRQLTDRKLTSKQNALAKSAQSIADLEFALSTIIDQRITPKPLPAGVPVLQPTELRRRTGSYYTPRQLTAPIVTEALLPVLDRLGQDATAEQILDLTVLDPALGSGAFLVEACRQLSERLVRAWERHGNFPALPPDEDAMLYAGRLIAQRCLYGVDRNPMAADLAKLSLWLATLARDHEFTFIDHAIQHGDALVGLFRDQIAGLSWTPRANQTFAAAVVDDALLRVKHVRELIQLAHDDTGNRLNQLLNEADQDLKDVTLIGDALVLAFFANDKPAARERARQRIEAAIAFGDSGWQGRLKLLTSAPGHSKLCPFHWETRFPEVFLRNNPGFDVIVGNPPYAGKNGIIEGNADNYLPWLQMIHEGSHGNADLVAHFFRRAFTLLRDTGTFGLIATNTIRQGDTRGTGLRWIREHNGIIYMARRRYRWPGEASVVVSVVHIAKSHYEGPCRLDGREVERITAYLFDQGSDSDPARLLNNANQSFIGCYVLGMGFTFDDTDAKGVASSLGSMRNLVFKNPRNQQRILPYIGGEEVTSDPLHAWHRYVIDFGSVSLAEAKQWPDLLDIVRERVLPARLKLRDTPDGKRLKERWWLFGRRRPALYRTIAPLKRVLVINCGATPHMAFTFLPTGIVYSHTLVVFAIDDYTRFAILQSRIHEVWARFFSSSMKDDLRYTPSDAYETFPFPVLANSGDLLQTIGRAYFEQRSSVMVNTRKGLTETYNRFNDPADDTEDIRTLRDLHSRMDRAVLDAYGWSDIAAAATFTPEWQDQDGDGPIRYRWPDETRDRVLAKLLDLNAQRADEDARGGARAENSASRVEPEDL